MIYTHPLTADQAFKLKEKHSEDLKEKVDLRDEQEALKAQRRLLREKQKE